jgi:hypothetical protein
MIVATLEPPTLLVAALIDAGVPPEKLITLRPEERRPARTPRTR